MNERIPTWAAGACVALFVVLALAFGTDRFGKPPPLDDIGPLKPEYYDTHTVRDVPKEPLFDGAPCASCHQGGEALQGDPKNKGVFHEKIELTHGRNEHCFNCHHRSNPATFSNFDNTPIPFSKIQMLCAKCHGTIYRDWLVGVHGRRSGQWNQVNVRNKPTVCIACHNPHWPVFKPIESKPAPHVNPRTQHGGAAAHEEGRG